MPDPRTLSPEEINTFVVWVERLQRKSHPQDEERVIAYILNQSPRIAQTLKSLSRQLENYRRKEVLLQEREGWAGPHPRTNQAQQLDYSTLAGLTPTELEQLARLADAWPNAGPQPKRWLCFIDALKAPGYRRDQICARSGLSPVTVQNYVGIVLYTVQQWRQEHAG